MTVSRRRSATRDIDEIAAYIGRDSPASAERFLSAVDATLRLLSVFPGAGAPLSTRRAAAAGVRRVTVSRFKVYVVYYVINQQIEVVRVLHSARDRDAIVEDDF